MLLVTASLCKRASDPWSIRPPGVVWEFIARTKTASGHLYRGLRSYGPGISESRALCRIRTMHWSFRLLAATC